MSSESSAQTQIRTAPTNLRWPPAHFEPQHSANGQPLCVDSITVIDRPLVEAEWDLVRAFVRRLDREDLRLRFGHAFDSRDEATLRRFFDVKAGIGEIALTLDEAGAIAGIVHRVMVSRSEAEIALIVRSDLKRAGIGEFLLRATLERSARQGLTTLSAVVLRENRPMLRLAAKVGCVPRAASALAAELTFKLDHAKAA